MPKVIILGVVAAVAVVLLGLWFLDQYERELEEMSSQE